MSGMLRIRRPIDKGLLVASAVIALGLGLIALAFASATTGRAALGLPDPVERISPGKGDSVLRQAEIVADLAPGYTGRLVIDRKAIEVVEVAAAVNVRPGQQVNQGVLVTKFDPGSNTLTYQPQEGAPIASFATGPHEVTVFYWKLTDPADVRSFTWQFSVTA